MHPRKSQRETNISREQGDKNTGVSRASFFGKSPVKAASLQGGRVAGSASVDKCYTVSSSCLKPALVTELQNGSQTAGVA